MSSTPKLIGRMRDRKAARQRKRSSLANLDDGSEAAGEGAADPGDAAVASQWHKVLDEESGAYYFYNDTTGASQWQAPPGFVDPEAIGFAPDSERVEESVDSGAVSAEAPAPAAGVLRVEAGWNVYYDAEAECEYFHNPITDTVEWDEPAEVLAEREATRRAEAEARDHALALAQEQAQAQHQLATGMPGVMAMTSEQLTAVAATLCYNRYKPHVPHPLAKHGAWELYVDPESQQQYYSNHDSGESLWTTPAEWDDSMAYVPPLAVFDDWEVYRDTDSLQEYYTNASLGLTTWEVPEALLVKVRRVDMQESQLALEAAEAAEAAAQAEREAAQAAQAEPEARVGDWEVYTDPESQHLYYYNPVTGESRWEAPDEVLHAQDEVWETPAEVQPVVQQVAQTQVQGFGVDAGGLLSRHESGLSVATELPTARSGGSGTPHTGRRGVLGGIEEMEVESLESPVLGEGGQAKVATPLRGAQVHSQRHFNTENEALRSTKRDGSGRIVIKPKAPAVKRFWESATSLEDVEDDVVEEMAEEVASDSDDAEAVAKPEAVIKAEREAVEAALARAESVRRKSLAAEAAREEAARKEREAEAAKAAAKAKWERELEEARAAKRAKDEADRVARREAEQARRKAAAEKARKPSLPNVLAAAGTSSSSSAPKPPPQRTGFKPGGATSHLSNAAFTSPSAAVTPGGGGSGRQMLLQMRAAAGTPTPGSAAGTAGAAQAPAEAPTIPAWMKRIPAPPKSTPAPRLTFMQSPAMDLRRPMFNTPMFTGAKKDYRPILTSSATAASSSAAPSPVKPPAAGTPKAAGEDKKPPPPKVTRTEADETDDWIRKRIEQVKEQKRLEAEEAERKARGEDEPEEDEEGDEEEDDKDKKGKEKDDDDDDDYSDDDFEPEDGDGKEKKKPQEEGGDKAKKGEEHKLSQSEMKEMIRRLRMSKEEADEFLAWRKSYLAEGDHGGESWTDVYQGFLKHQDALAVEALAKRRANMSERIAKLEDAKLKHEQAMRQKRATEMKKWEEESKAIRERVRAKRAAMEAKRLAQAESEAAKRRANYEKKKAEREARKRKREEAIRAKRQGRGKKREAKPAEVDEVKAAREAARAERLEKAKAKRVAELKAKAEKRAQQKKEREQLAQKARVDAKARAARRAKKEREEREKNAIPSPSPELQKKLNKQKLFPSIRQMVHPKVPGVESHKQHREGAHKKAAPSHASKPAKQSAGAPPKVDTSTHVNRRGSGLVTKKPTVSIGDGEPEAEVAVKAKRSKSKQHKSSGGKGDSGQASPKQRGRSKKAGHDEGDGKASPKRRGKSSSLVKQGSGRGAGSPSHRRGGKESVGGAKHSKRRGRSKQRGEGAAGTLSPSSSQRSLDKSKSGTQSKLQRMSVAYGSSGSLKDSTSASVARRLGRSAANSPSSSLRNIRDVPEPAVNPEEPDPTRDYKPVLGARARGGIPTNRRGSYAADARAQARALVEGSDKAELQPSHSRPRPAKLGALEGGSRKPKPVRSDKASRKRAKRLAKLKGNLVKSDTVRGLRTEQESLPVPKPKLEALPARAEVPNTSTSSEESSKVEEPEPAAHHKKHKSKKKEKAAEKRRKRKERLRQLANKEALPSLG